MSDSTVLLIDFDGTISERDVMDMLVQHLAGDVLVELEHEFRNGQLTHGEINSKLSEMIRATPSEIYSYLDKSVKLRDGFLDLYKIARSEALPLVILSAGWDIYIKFSLDKFGIPFKSWGSTNTEREKYYVDLVCNDLVHLSEDRWQVKLREDMGMCDLSAPCKGTLAKHFASQGFKNIICAGNGNNDLCMAREATKVFARDSLAKACTRENIPFDELETFYPVIEYLRALNIT